MRKAEVPPNPSGLCMCGCGALTAIWTRSKPSRGEFAGHHQRYLPGHYGSTQTGSKASKWKGGRIKQSTGYIYVAAPWHPAATKRDGYVLEHRLVAEATIGRYLTRGESVHHINGDKTDNRPENLEVMTKREHGQHHDAMYMKRWAATIDPAELTERRRAAGRKGAAIRWGLKPAPEPLA